jgi:hypothetical protein
MADSYHKPPDPGNKTILTTPFYLRQTARFCPEEKKRAKRF